MLAGFIDFILQVAHNLLNIDTGRIFFPEQRLRQIVGCRYVMQSAYEVFADNEENLHRDG